MLDVGWQELLVIGVVAIIVIGPKDLPVAIRTVAQWVKKARDMAGEFQRGVDEMVREADLADVRKQVEQAATGVVDDVQKMATTAMEDVKTSIDPNGEIEKSLLPPDALTQPPGFEQGPPAPVTTASIEPPPVDLPAPVEAQPTIPAGAVETAKPTPAPGA